MVNVKVLEVLSVVLMFKRFKVGQKVLVIIKKVLEVL